MLEERLSKAYSQHSIGGYNLPPPRQAAGPYPSLQPGAPSAPGPAESFYTGEQQQQQDYGRPLGHPSYPQPAPQPQYASYDKRGSVVGPSNSQYPPQPMPQRTGSWSAAPPGQAPQYNQQPSYPPNEASQASQLQQAPGPVQLSAPTPGDSVGTTPTADPSASFYFNSQSQQQAQQPPTSPPDPAMSPYPNLSQPISSYQPSLPQTPASVPAQPSQPQQQQQAPPQAQQPYWQHPAAQQTALPPVWQAPPPSSAYPGYTQEAFPSAPQHAPKQPVIEESLIDL